MRYIPILLLLAFVAFSQETDNNYKKLIEKADSLYQDGSFKEAAYMYTEAFKVNGWKGFIPEIYNSARAWAWIGNLDSAFRKLDRVVTYARHAEFENYGDFQSEPAFRSLQRDGRWQTLIIKAEKKFDDPLIRELEAIFRADQEYRLLIDSVIEKFGSESEEAKLLWQKMRLADSTNVVKVKEILDKYGWLGPDVVGQRGNITLFLVIQHADLTTQLKYLSLMRKAVRHGDAEAGHLALLEDRLALKQGKKQIYGSQVALDKSSGKYFVESLKDPENVDRRRAAVGLPPLSEYLKDWGIDWNVDDYKLQTKKRKVRAIN